jgi:MFS family permease
MKILTLIRLLLIGLWLGAACFFSFAVTQSAFAVLPTRELAGLVVSRTLTIVNFSGLFIGIILLLSSFIKQAETNRYRLAAERVLLVIFTLGCAVGQFVIGLWLSYVRMQINRPIDELAVDDPLRITFNNLHQYSVWVLIAAICAALIAFFLIGKQTTVKTMPLTAKI